MQTVRETRTEHYSVAQCPICKGEHQYDFQAVIDEMIGVSYQMMVKTETKACSVSCPEKGGSFVVDVPVTLYSGQTLVALR